MHTLIVVAGEDMDAILLPYFTPEIAPREVLIEGDELRWMAEHYGIEPSNTCALAAKIREYYEEDGFERDGRLFRISCENPDARGDWYTVGGRWGRGFLLKEPRPSRRCFGLLAGPPATHATTARKWEIDQEHLLRDPPAGLVDAIAWSESPIVLDGPLPAEWRDEFARLFAAIPDETLLHAVDIHS